MTRKPHSLGIKLFIFFLVAMMIFSAVGVMVIYLNVPTITAPVFNTLPSDPAPIQPTEDQGAIEKTVIDESGTPPTEEPLLDAPQPADEAATPPTAEEILPPADTQ